MSGATFTAWYWLFGQPQSHHRRHQPNNPIEMRTLLLSAAATLLFSMPALAQEKTNTTTPAKVTPTMEAPSDDMTAQKRSLSGELKNTLGMADGLLANANKMLVGASEADTKRISNVIEGAKSVQSDVTAQLDLVGQASDKNYKEVFAKATDVNGSSMKMLEQLKGQLMPAGK
jgi:hypothetical protein